MTKEQFPPWVMRIVIVGRSHDLQYGTRIADTVIEYVKSCRSLSEAKEHLGGIERLLGIEYGIRVRTHVR